MRGDGLRAARRVSWLAAALVALVAGAQESEEPAVLGQPADWALDDAEAETAIPLPAGSALHLEPDRGSEVLAYLPEVRLPLLGSRGPWVRVRYGDRIGWVDVEAPLSPSKAPGPPAVSVPEPLDLGPGWLEEELGPYTLFSQVSDRGLIDDLGRVARDHARLYAERYGLPAAETGGRVVLFGGREPFLEFQRARGHELAEDHVDGYFRSPDLVVLCHGFRSRRETAATLIHELTHLLTWRALNAGGRASASLPPWLEEGLADDLSLARIDRQGRLRAEPLGPTNLHYGRRLGAILRELTHDVAEEGTAPSLPALMAMDDAAFRGGDARLHYVMASLWIRHLLADDQLAAGFRAFLAAVAGGGSAHPDALAGHLGHDWPRLSSGFRGWLLRQRARFGV